MISMCFDLADASEDPEMYDDYPPYDDYEDEYQPESWRIRVSMMSVLAALVVSLGLSLGLSSISGSYEIKIILSSQPEEISSPVMNALAAQEEVGGIAPLFTKEVQYWEHDILRWADQWQLDPNLVATVMQIESCGDPEAVSRAGATGLFQVMPFHFKENENAFDTETNALRGLGYLLKSLEDKNGDIRLGLAGYNGGISGSRRPESEWPNEVHRYVYWGVDIYQDALRGAEESERLNEWLGRGGASLCQQASRRLDLTQ